MIYVLLLAVAVFAVSYVVAYGAVRLLSIVIARAARRREQRRLRASGTGTNTITAARADDMVLVVASALFPFGARFVRVPDGIGAILLSIGILTQILAWIMHSVPGHRRAHKYAMLGMSSTGLMFVPWLFAQETDTRVSWFWTGWMLLWVGIALVLAIVRLRVFDAMEPGSPAAAAAARWHRRLTWLQGPDVKSLIVWTIMCFTGVGLAYLILRFLVGEKIKTRPFLYLRSFAQQDADLVFGTAIMPALYRLGAVSGLVHISQPSTKLHANMPALWRARFQSVSDAQWKEWVAHRLVNCAGVILDLSQESESLWWELETAERIVGKERMLILSRGQSAAGVGNRIETLNLKSGGIGELADPVSRWAHDVAQRLWTVELRPIVTRRRWQFTPSLLALPLAITLGAFGFGHAVEKLLVIEKRPRTRQVSIHLRALVNAAKSTWSATGAFPAPVGPTPSVGSCCLEPSGKCMPRPELWDTEGWQRLDFGIFEPDPYSYAFDSDATSFTARAIGDLDCDETFSTFEITVRVIDGELVQEPPVETDPLE